MRFVAVLILLFLMPLPDLSAQLSLDGNSFDPAEYYQQAFNSVVIRENRNNLLPLKNLDSLRIAYLPLLMQQDELFTSTLRKYTNIHKLDVPAATTPSITAKLIENRQKESGFNLLVIAIGQPELSAPHRQLLKQLTGPYRTVLFWSNPADQQLEDLQADAIIVGPQSQGAQSIAAQLLFGGVAASGLSQKAYNQKREELQLSDIRTEKTRLGYAPPEWLGINGQLLKSRVDSIVQEGLDSAAYPGAQILVVKDGYIFFHETYGYHTYEKKRAVRPDDIYDYASVTKVTAALPALMRLHGQGRFDLDAQLEDYFPVMKRSNKGKLSFRSILAHNAQLKAWIAYWTTTIKKNGKFRARTFKRKSSRRFPIRITDDLYLHRKYKKRIYKAIKKSPLNEEPGYVYSGLVFYLFPEIISRITGEPFPQHLYQTFYEPLGAHTITYNPLEKFPKDRIVPTERDTFFRMIQIHGEVHDEGAAMMGGISGNAGLFSSANDLAKLAQMYLNKGTYGGQRFIEASSVEEFTRCQYCHLGNRRGLGFDKPVVPYDPEKSPAAQSASPQSYGHSGYTGTYLWIDPAENLIYIFFSNRVYPTRDNRKLYTMNIRPRIHQVIYEAIQGKNQTQN